ncbi:MAG: DUF3179 domain-containing protein [bacterium]
MRIGTILTVILAGILVAIVGWQVYLRVNDIDLPSGETVRDVVVVDSEGNIIEPGEEADALPRPPQAIEQEEAEKQIKADFQMTREIFVTDGVRHSVPLDEIIGGGPHRDGIPSIDNPKFISIDEAKSWLSDEEPGIAFSAGGVDRFYPFQILVWHEIVNDTIPVSAEASAGKGGQRILVTYCPLCLSGIVFDPVVKGERVEFGTSGKLWQSNLVMYDRKSETLWSQILGEAILGELTGTRLKVLPSDQVKFGNWRAEHPGGEVLSRDTGAIRFYGRDPYGDYYTTPGTFFPVAAKDNRLNDKDFVLGIVINGKAKAYWPPAIKKQSEITDEFQDKIIIARYEQDLDVVRLFEKKSDGTLERVIPFGTFWFSWIAAHPDTELLK